MEEVDERANAVPARRRRPLAFDLGALAIVGVLLIAALGAGAVGLYRQLYSPTAFVSRYLDLLAQGRTAEALTLPGVPVDSTVLEQAGLPGTADEALLRPAALAPLSEVAVVGEEERDGITYVTATYRAGPHEGTTVFQVEPAGWPAGLPTWRFAQSPLAVVELTVRGSRQFQVNGFEVDTRQVSPAGVDADPLAPVALLVFSPGLYSMSVDTPVSHTPGVAVLSDTPAADIPVDLQTEPTTAFVEVVQERVEAFLTECTTQQVLQPTGCPFGFTVQNRIVDPPTWTIAQQPTIALEADGAGWRIRRTQAIAHIRVDIRSIFDGAIRHVDEDVPFFLDGGIEILPDGTASIVVNGVD